MNSSSPDRQRHLIPKHVREGAITERYFPLDNRRGLKYPKRKKNISVKVSQNYTRVVYMTACRKLLSAVRDDSPQASGCSDRDVYFNVFHKNTPYRLLSETPTDNRLARCKILLV